MKPKQWLKDNGHIADATQRGRLSRDHIALIEQAVRDGAQIEGYAVSTVQPETAVEKKVDRVKIDPSRILDVPDEVRNEQAWEAHTYADGKKVSVGMREVCEGCGNSLTYCYCRVPSVRGDLITFVARTKPYTRPW